MRSRVALLLCLPLLLVGCGGGLLPTPASVPPSPVTVPSASPTASATPTAARPTATAAVATTAVLSPTVEATPGPLSAADAPEIAAGLMPEAERDQYLNLVAAMRERDPLAADWLTNTGLFLRDARLDGNEAQLLNALLQSKGDPLWHLTHIRTMLGVDSTDVQYLSSIVPLPADVWYFTDDLKGLQAFELLSEDGRRSLQRIFARAHDDPEVCLGLYLVNIMGMPDPRDFSYPVPGYNVQLDLLARLLEQGIPGDYERAAVAAALTYGSLMTVCDDAAREQVVAYATERVRFLIDCDVLLAAAGADWLARDYPLEALMVLLWGGQAPLYPEPGTPLSEARDLDQAAAEQPLTPEDLDRLLLPVESLQQMQDEMMRAVVERSTHTDRACALVADWWSANRGESPDLGGPNPGAQWARYQEGSGFAGGAEAGYVLQGLAASINLPVPWAQLGYAEDGQLRLVPFGLHVDPARRTLRLGDPALSALAGLPPDTPAALVWWRPPWDNWQLDEGSRSWQTLPLPLSLWQAGVPSGYLLRQSVGTDDEMRAALGIPVSPTPEAPAEGS